MPPNHSHDRVKHFIAGEATTIRECLRKHFRLDDGQVDSLLTSGSIYSDKKRVYADRALAKGGYLRIHLQPKRFPAAQINWADTILFEDAQYLLFNKPNGIPVHATVDNATDNALSSLREVTRLPLLVTQRLDIPVSGIMLFAKTPEFQRRFNKWLIDRRVHKRYCALTMAAPPLGKHVHFMEPSERSPKRVSLIETQGWLRCELTVHSVTRHEKGFEVEVELHTGRTHQIRVQLQALDAPILGDNQYGCKLPSPVGPNTIALASVLLEFPTPDNKLARYTCPPPWSTQKNTDGAKAPSVS
jgi:23S rRNA pseudouridine1911/1915/1917 synthase